MIVFKHPFTCIISGPSGCGKTSFCIPLIANLDRLCTVSDFRDIVWCFSEDSAIPHKQLAGAGRRIIYNRGIPDLQRAINDTRLVVLNDLLNEA
jgi:KaiC/GvpD/RAD55 family RecA-like ATPase